VIRQKAGNPATLKLLREVYIENLRDGSASASSIGARLGVAPALIRSSLRDASANKLVRTTKGLVELTPPGRRRLKVVMMGGAFEIIHPGHINALSEARRLGNTLVVVVATDGSVEKNKGRPPVTNQALRVGLVSSIRQVDLALPGNKGSIYDILLMIRPDVVALGYDQRHNGEEIVQEAARRGIRIRTARLGSQIPDLKTSKILHSL
jgi:cytidyltransferase-like protein